MLTIFVRINHLTNEKQLKINYSFAIPPNKKHHLLRMQIDFCHRFSLFVSFQMCLRWTLLYRIHFSLIINRSKKILYLIGQAKKQLQKFDSICSLWFALVTAPTYRTSKCTQSFLNAEMQSICQLYMLSLSTIFSIEICKLSAVLSDQKSEIVTIFR